METRSPTIWMPDKWPTFCQKTSRFWIVQFLNGWDHSYQSFENQTIWNLIFKKSLFQMLPYFEMVKFQILTVFKVLHYYRHTNLTQITSVPILFIPQIIPSHKCSTCSRDVIPPKLHKFKRFIIFVFSYLRQLFRNLFHKQVTIPN